MNFMQKMFGKTFRLMSIGIIIALMMAIFTSPLTAAILPGPFSLQYSAGTGGYLDGETSQVVELGGSGSPVEAIPDLNYHFVNWSDDSIQNPRIDTNVTYDVDVTANFAIDTFTLIYTAGPNGSISGETTQIVNFESNGTTVTAIADTGYRFVNWSDGSTENPRTDYEVTANIEVTANFAFLYTVTFDSQGGSTVTDELVPSGGWVDYPTAPSKSGLYFAGWYKEASCENIWHSRLDVISSNTTLYAKWNETAPKIAIFYGDSTGADVQAKLLSTGLFSQVDLLPVNGATPTLSILKQYNAVLIYTAESTYADSVSWGNVLADYLDIGGGVVMGVFSWVNPEIELGIDGRISTAGYLPFIQAPQGGDYNLTLIADDNSNPILNGVNTFDGGTSSYLSKVSLTPDAHLIAHWSNDYPLVATKQLTAGRVAGLNFLPLSSDVRSDYWVSSTDGALLMANSLMWAASTFETINPPTITSDGGGDSASVSIVENQTAVTTVTVTDPDSMSFTYSISGGDDASWFTIDATSGVLTFKEAPDFEKPLSLYKTNVYKVTVQVSDGELTDSQNISVTVTNAPNEAPVITSHGGGTTADINAKENQTAVSTVTASDPDGNTLTYSISGGSDAGFFSIDQSTGVLTFKVAPDFETKADANSDGIYEVIIEVSDGVLTDTQTINVTVTLLTPVDLLKILKSDIFELMNAGGISKSTANGLVRSIDKAIAKIDAGDQAGALKLLNSLITTINRQTPSKIAATDSADLLAQINLVIARLNG